MNELYLFGIGIIDDWNIWSIFRWDRLIKGYLRIPNGHTLEDIIKNPTYLARNQKKKSIEFIKEYKTQSDDHVLIAVRVSNNGVHFARTMYIMADEKVEKYLKHNYFHKF